MESCPQQKTASPPSRKNGRKVALMAVIVMIGLGESIRTIHCETVRLPLQCQTNLLAIGLVPPAAPDHALHSLWSRRAETATRGRGHVEIRISLANLAALVWTTSPHGRWSPTISPHPTGHHLAARAVAAVRPEAEATKPPDNAFCASSAQRHGLLVGVLADWRRCGASDSATDCTLQGA
jgi:hypothetical protein